MKKTKKVESERRYRKVTANPRLTLHTLKGLYKGESELPGALDIITYMIRNPDEGSEFDIRTRPIRHLPDDALLGAIISNNYDVLIGERYGGLVGLEGYQAHQQEDSLDWHMFRIHVEESAREQGFGTELAIHLIEHGKMNGVDRIRFGKGGNDYVVRIVHRLAEWENML